MAFELTREQQNAVDANGKVLVSAAAGSGKTAVLVERVMRRFCNEESPLMADRALIVTFTNAAAAELKIKIESKLQQMVAENPHNFLLRRQSMLIKSAKICTIDSFCISLVKEYFNLLDIFTDFKTTDASELNEDYTEILEDIFKEKHNSYNEHFQYLLNALQTGYDDYYLKQIVSEIYDKSCSMPYQFKWLDGLVEQYIETATNFEKSKWVETICDSLLYHANFAYNEAINLKSEALADDNFFNKYEAQISARVNFAKSIVDALRLRNWDAVYNELKSHNSDTLKKNNTKDAMISAAIVNSKNAENNLIKKLKESFLYDKKTALKSTQDFSVIIQYISEIVKEYIERIYENSVQKNVFTFDQIEHMALKLLTENTDIVTENFNQNYDSILVDEYQDTNNLQDEIFNILSAKKGELFMVGDVKQSIYGFRNANPDNFLTRKDTYPDYSPGSKNSKILLSGNFRSRKGVCDFANYLFSAYMTKSDADMDYTEDEALIPLGEYPENNESAVEIYLTEPQEGQNNPSAEANLIADYIEATLQKEPFLRADNGALRKAEIDDFCILMRSPKNKIKHYVEVFKSRGIPVSTPSQKFSEASEIIAAMSLLKAIDNFNDCLSLAALLKTPIFNFDENEIAEIRVKNKYIPLYLNLKNAATEGNKKAEYAYNFLLKASRLSATLPVHKLLSKLFAECGFIEIYSSLTGGEMRKANLRLLIEKADAYNYADKGISDFVKFIESDSNTSLSANIITSDKSVQIMSVHNSKGLQFPICIVCGLNSEFNLRDSSNKIIGDDNLGIAFDYNDCEIGSVITPISKIAIKRATINKTYKEELRLLYVALTRACEKLVLVSSVNKVDTFLEKVSEIAKVNSSGTLPFNKNALYNCSSYAQWIFSAIICHKNGNHLKRGEQYVPIVNNDCYFTVKLYDNAESQNLSNRIDVSISEFCEKDFDFNYNYPYKQLNTVPAKTSVTDILGSSTSAELVFSEKPKFMFESGYTSIEKGTATHKFMEYCDYGTASISIDDEINRLYEWQYISLDEAEIIDKESVKAFFESYVYSTILKAKCIHKEYRFLTKVKAKEISSDITDDSEYSIVQGVADCIIENDNDIIIVDFKTDKIKDEDILKTRYKKQLDLYSNALQEIFNKPVSKKILYSFYLKKCIEI